MKYFSLIFVVLLNALNADAQQHDFTASKIRLPEEISDYDNQFSGLQISNGALFMMSESRLQDNKEAKLYSIKLADIERQLKDSTYELPFKKITIYGLHVLRNKMKEQEQVYEGLEAFIIDNKTVYFSVETNTPSANCYFIKGKLSSGSVYLDSSLLAVTKPRQADGSAVYNAGFEAIALIRNRLYGFYEYNYFEHNYVYGYNPLFEPGKDSVLTDKIPFRITDITPAGNNHFTAINFFFKGGGADTVYRVPATDSNYALINTSNNFHNYCRLVDIDASGEHLTWKNLWEFPAAYQDYNWEGMAAYKKGYFIINDKYGPARPYSSVLLYLH
ncbi:MAG: hypothetical protein QM791_10870 [Ferruginibacter sp.]